MVSKIIMNGLELDDLRTRIDNCDRDILNALARRDELTRGIAAYKAERSWGIHDPVREGELLQNREQQGRELGLYPGLVEAVFTIVLNFSKKRQEEIISLPVDLK